MPWRRDNAVAPALPHGEIKQVRYEFVTHGIGGCDLLGVRHFGILPG